MPISKIERLFPFDPESVIYHSAKFETIILAGNKMP